MQMTNENYAARLIEYADKVGFKVSDSEAAELAAEYNGNLAPSLLIAQIAPPKSNRKNKKSEAEKSFQPVFLSACSVFGENPDNAKTATSENWRDLRRAACYVGVTVLEIRPVSAIVKITGLKTVSVAYNSAKYAKRRMSESQLFFNAVEKIIQQSKTNVTV